MSVLDVPRPSWMSDDLDLLSATARRFFNQDCVPHYERWEAQGSVDREVWTL